MSGFGKILKISEYFIPFHNGENNIVKNTLNDSRIKKYLNKKDSDLNDETIELKSNENYGE